jgi:hypothetical protein
MKNYICIFLLFFLPIYTSHSVVHNNNKTPSNNILIVLFPGGIHKNLQIIDLLISSLTNNSSFIINYSVIIHTGEVDLFKSEIPLSLLHKFSFYTYGIPSDIETIDIDDLPKQPYFQFYQVKLRRFYQDFLDSNILSELSQMQKKFHIIISDRPNYINFLLQQLLQIENKMYLSMRPFPQLFYKIIEYNPNYTPLLGNDLTDEMNYKERCTNFFNYLSQQLILYLSRYEIKYLFNDYGYKQINTTNYYFNDAITLIQYPIGITFPLSLPPNVITLNALEVDNNKSNKEINIKFNEQIKEFISLFNHIVIISKDVNFYVKKEVVDEFINECNKKYTTGFIMLNINNKNNVSIKGNVLIYEVNSITSYFNYLHYFMEIKEVSVLITPSIFREITVAIYHKKPIISLNNGWYHDNINAYIKKKMIGLIVDSSNINNSQIYVKYIFQLYDNEEEIDNINIYRKSAIKISTIMHSSKRAMNEFNLWLNYGLNNKYSLIANNAYVSQSWIAFYGYDILIICLSAVIVLLYIIFYILTKLYKCCKSKIQLYYKVKSD